MQKLATMIRNLATSSRVPRPCHQSFTSFSFSWQRNIIFHSNCEIQFFLVVVGEKLRGKRSDLDVRLLDLVAHMNNVLNNFRFGEYTT